MTGVTFPDSMSSFRISRSSGILLGDERAQLLSHERRQQLRSDLTSHPDPASTAFPANDDERPFGDQTASEPRQRTIASDVEDQVVACARVGEVVACVVDHVVRAETLNHVDLRRAAHGGDFAAEGFGQLHGDAPHGS